MCDVCADFHDLLLTCESIINLFILQSHPRGIPIFFFFYPKREREIVRSLLHIYAKGRGTMQHVVHRLRGRSIHTGRVVELSELGDYLGGKEAAVAVL